MSEIPTALLSISADPEKAYCCGGSPGSLGSVAAAGAAMRGARAGWPVLDAWVPLIGRGGVRESEDDTARCKGSCCERMPSGATGGLTAGACPGAPGTSNAPAVNRGRIAPIHCMRFPAGIDGRTMVGGLGPTRA